jgi:hypothetical protein
LGFLAFLAVVNIILTPVIFVAALIKRQFWWIIPSLLIYVVWYFVGPEFLTYEFEMGFGSGAIVTLSSIVAALLSIVLFLVGAVVIIRSFWKDKFRWRWYAVYLIGAIFFVSIQPLPVAESQAEIEDCDRLNREEIETIAAALERYKAEHSEYPKGLGFLVPTYLESIPKPHCFEKYEANTETVSAQIPKFTLEKCFDEKVYLTIPVITYGWTQRYDLETGEWAKLDFLDWPGCQ